VIELDYVITNGCIDKETIDERFKKGWNFVTTVPAKSVHPYAMETDKVTIFSRYKQLEAENTETQSK
jgi:hypothetical protein